MKERTTPVVTASACTELTMMLAQATEGPLAGFRMTDLDRYDPKMAGLLHDSGKITTPVHVVDKGTKLQTLFDRIGLIDTRFEVLKRDAEIATLRQQLALRPVVDAAAEAALRSQNQITLTALEDERTFVRQANIGGQVMSDADVNRVRSVGASRSWRNPDGVQTLFLTSDELENLCIRKGTLTAAERDVINYHTVATIKMLEKLPWSKHLKNVPEYPRLHHERMDGRGYPKGLTREQMSVQARIMGLRGAHRCRPTLQARHEALASHAHHEKIKGRWPHRPRSIRYVSAPRRLSALR
jgi:hypothetical protein